MKEVSVTNFKVFSQHFPVDNEENYGNKNSVRKHDLKVDFKQGPQNTRQGL